MSYADIELCICILRLEHTELMGSLSLNAVVPPHTHTQLAVPWDSTPPRQGLYSAASGPRVNTTRNGGGCQEGVVRAAVLCCCVPLLMRDSDDVKTLPPL